MADVAVVKVDDSTLLQSDQRFAQLGTVDERAIAGGVLIDDLHVEAVLLGARARDFWG